MDNFVDLHLASACMCCPAPINMVHSLPTFQITLQREMEGLFGATNNATVVNTHCFTF